MNKNKRLTAVIMAIALIFGAMLVFTACDEKAEATITKIEIKTPAAKTAYALGEDFSAAGLVVQKVMSDGAKVDLAASDYSITHNFNSIIAGTYTVTITLKSDAAKTAEYSVTVYDVDAVVLIFYFNETTSITKVFSIGELEFLIDLLFENETSLGFEYTDGAWGIMIDAIYGLEPDPSCEYISVYTSLTDFAGEPWGEEAADITVNGITCFYATVGANDMPLEAGAAFLFLILGF